MRVFQLILIVCIVFGWSSTSVIGKSVAGEDIAPNQRDTIEVFSDRSFDSQFNSRDWRWIVRAGSWFVSPGVWSTYGMRTKRSSVMFNERLYRNFDMTARVRFTHQNCAGNDYGLYVRGTGPLLSDGQWPNAAYLSINIDSMYSTYGRYHTGIIVNGYNYYKDRDYSSAVNKWNWNVLRIRAVNNTYYFYVNGRMVTYWDNSGLYQGKVGIHAYPSSSCSPSNQFQIDYAKLTKLR